MYKTERHLENPWIFMENKISSLYSDETKILTWFKWRKLFSKIFALYYQKSMEFLSSLVFHTVTIQVIPHYYKQSLVQ